MSAKKTCRDSDAQEQLVTSIHGYAVDRALSLLSENDRERIEINNQSSTFDFVAT